MTEIMNRWKVCIRCSTYNHSLYVAETLDGFVCQQTNFPFVAVIVDDASTDGEQQVLMNYLSDNFEKCELSYEYDREDDEAVIHFARHKENKSCHFAVVVLKYNHYSLHKSKESFFDIWSQESEYIAFCEGDDYWIDPRKLQRQVTVLDTHPDVGLVYCKAKVYCQRDRRFKGSVGRRCSGIEELIYRNAIGTLTVLFRKDYYKEYLGIKDDNWKMGDYPLWLLIAGKTRLYFINQKMAVYRYLEESMSHSPDISKVMMFQDSVRDIQLFFFNYYKIGSKDLIMENDNRARLAYSFSYGVLEQVKFYYQVIDNHSITEKIKLFLSLHPRIYRIYRLLNSHSATMP